MVWEFMACLAKHNHRLGREEIESSPAVKDLGMVGDETGYESAMCSSSPENKLYLGLHQKRHGQQVEGGDCYSLLCFCETPSAVQHPPLWPQHKKDVDLQAQSRGG